MVPGSFTETVRKWAGYYFLSVLTLFRKRIFVASVCGCVPLMETRLGRVGGPWIHTHESWLLFFFAFMKVYMFHALNIYIFFIAQNNYWFFDVK